MEVIAWNAWRVVLLGSAAFALGGALFLYLSFPRIRVPARKMRLLGVQKARVFREMLLAVGLPTAAAASKVIAGRMAGQNLMGSAKKRGKGHKGGKNGK